SRSHWRQYRPGTCGTARRCRRRRAGGRLGLARPRAQWVEISSTSSTSTFDINFSNFINQTVVAEQFEADEAGGVDRRVGKVNRISRQLLANLGDGLHAVDLIQDRRGHRAELQHLRP